MLNVINDFANDDDLSVINIRDKHEISYTETILTDYRIDTLMFNHYGYNLNLTYGLSSEVIIFLVFMFNDFSNLLEIRGVIKLPVISQLLDNLEIDNSKNVNGVYTNEDIILDSVINTSSKIVDELKLRLKKSQIYDPLTGSIKY